MSAIAIIPARGGSKGVPGKNLRHVGGLPLVARAVLAARGARAVARTVVSTDDAQIARVAQAHGAQVVDRPASLSGDEASSESALLHALETLREEGPLPERLAFLQCTSPLTTSADVDATLALLDAGADSAFTATPSHAFLWRREADGRAAGVNHDPARRPRRQERAPEYRETGAVYAMRLRGFLEHRHRFFGNVRMHVVPAERSWEIDDETDLVVADALHRATTQEASHAIHR